MATAVAGLTATAIVDALMPNYAAAQQVSKTDERIKASYETVPSPNGNGSIRGYFVRPFSADTGDATPAKLPGVIIIQEENRGLNPHTEDVARRFALGEFHGLCPGRARHRSAAIRGDDYKGGLLFNKVDKAKMIQEPLAAARWPKGCPDRTGKIGATGFCFGGGMGRIDFVAVLMGSGSGGCGPLAAPRPSLEDVPTDQAPPSSSTMDRWTKERWMAGQPRKLH